jgi:hypothetical protein
MPNIYIPTLGRATAQNTWNRLPDSLRARTVLVVDAAEQALHSSYPTVCPPKEIHGIGKVRQWIIDQHDVKQNGFGIIMLDDDLRFDIRRKDDPTKFVVLRM